VKQKKFVIFAVSLALLVIIGCLFSQSIFLQAVLAKYKSTDHFVVLGDDQRIRYEKSAEANAIEAASEWKQGASGIHPPRAL
jgi:hypothetical protein